MNAMDYFHSVEQQTNTIIFRVISHSQHTNLLVYYYIPNNLNPYFKIPQQYFNRTLQQKPVLHSILHCSNRKYLRVLPEPIFHNNPPSGIHLQDKTPPQERRRPASLHSDINNTFFFHPPRIDHGSFHPSF